MKNVLKLVLLATTLFSLTGASYGAPKNMLVGTWTLLKKSCEPDGTYLEKLKAKMTRVDRMVYSGEILIISDDSTIRRFDDNGRMLSEGDYILTASNELLVKNELRAKSSTGRFQIKKLMVNQLITEHKGDVKCPGGIVKSNYTKVQTNPHYSYEQGL